VRLDGHTHRLEHRFDLRPRCFGCAPPRTRGQTSTLTAPQADAVELVREGDEPVECLRGTSAAGGLNVALRHSLAVNSRAAVGTNALASMCLAANVLD
jgi:hypothetical protein